MKKIIPQLYRKTFEVSTANISKIKGRYLKEQKNLILSRITENTRMHFSCDIEDNLRRFPTPSHNSGCKDRIVLPREQAFAPRLALLFKLSELAAMPEENIDSRASF